MLLNLIVPRSSNPEQLSLADLEAAAGNPVEQPSAAQAARTQPAPAGAEPPAVPTATVAEEAGSTSAEAVLALVTSRLAQLNEVAARPPLPGVSLEQARDEWLRRLRTACRSESAITAYRIAIDDLLAWAGDRGQSVFDETTIVDYLAHYQRHAQPAPATYYRRFGLLRRFLRWLSRRNGLPDPFLELEAPPKPQQEADWLTTDEFAQLLAAAAAPPRRRPGLAERDRLVLLALLQTGLRRSELLALDWTDLDLNKQRPSLLVRRGKGGKPRRQPLAPALARELAELREQTQATPDAPVFCGLEGKRLQPTILANIIRRAAERAGLAKHVTAHTLRHSAATWLRQETGDARLVAAYLGHADLSTVSRYAHVAPEELHLAAEAIAARSSRGEP
jgi:site-specific recombinase XerD